MAEAKLRLKPAEGRKVRHLDGRVLDAEGEAVNPSTYWDRRLAAGDVEPATPLKKPNTQTKEA